MNTSGDRLKALLLESELTPSDFAAQRKITAQHVNNWFKRGVPLARLDELAELFCVHPRWLRSGEGPKYPEPLKPARPTPASPRPQAPLRELDTHMVQLPLHRLNDGLLQPICGLYQQIPRWALERLRVAPATACCICMPGNNLAPQLPLGAVLAIDRNFTQVVEGEYYALRHNGQLRVHQLSKGPNDLLYLHSHERINHPTERYTPQQREAQQLEILGWVFWWSCLRPSRPG